MNDAVAEPRPAGDRPRTWAHFAPWLLLAVAGSVALVAAADVWNPSMCENAAFDRGATGWSGAGTSLWPPGQACELAFTDGPTVFVEHRTWLPVPAVALGALVTLLGLVRPPNPEWRRAALVTCVPGVLGVLVLALAF